MIKKYLLWTRLKKVAHTWKHHMSLLILPIKCLVCFLILCHCFDKFCSLAIAQEVTEFNNSSFNLSNGVGIQYSVIDFLGGEASNGVDALELSKNYSPKSFSGFIEFGGTAIFARANPSQIVIHEGSNEIEQEATESRARKENHILDKIGHSPYFPILTFISGCLFSVGILFICTQQVIIQFLDFIPNFEISQANYKNQIDITI